MKHDYHNSSDMDERYKIIVEERRANTYLSHTHDEAGGRYRKLEPQSIVGQTPIPEAYPGAPWTRETPGDEPPTGVDINWQEPVGEPHEIAASIDVTPASSAAPADVGGDRAPRRFPFSSKHIPAPSKFKPRI